jgi:sec-independent protein translocase protein TatB
MFPLEQGAFEMLLIGAIALIVVGPKDLPMLMRKVGQFTAKMRGLAAEFRASFDEMARQSELDDLRREVEALRTGTYTTPTSSAETEHSLSAYNPDPYPTGYPSPPEEPVAEPAAEPAAAAPPEPKAPAKPRAKKAATTSDASTLPKASAKPRKPRAAKTAETEG